MPSPRTASSEFQFQLRLTLYSSSPLASLTCRTTVRVHVARILTLLFVAVMHTASASAQHLATLPDDPPAGALAACEYTAEGDVITGLRTRWDATASRLQCNPAWKSDAAGVRSLVAKLVSESGKTSEQNGSSLACAHLLLGLDTLSRAQDALATAPPEGLAASQTLKVVSVLKAGAKWSLATASACKPAGLAEAIPNDIWADMQDKSWHAHAGCPAREDLSLLHIPYRDFEDRTRFGEMIVARTAADDVLSAFAYIYAAGGFPIASMRRVDAFGGNDMASMNANNTSAFNCRVVQGTTVLSEHGKGLAIDINPIENPYVGATLLQPDAGARYRERSTSAPGMIHEGDMVVEAFRRVGWTWGGGWKQAHDYQHFSRSGR